MSEIRQVLIHPIVIYVMLLTAFTLIFILDLKGKLKSRFTGRKKFDKKHPGLNKKLTIIAVCTIYALSFFVFKGFIVDYIVNNTVSAQGYVESIESDRGLFTSVSINHETYYNWSRISLKEGKYYFIDYTPESKVIINAIQK